MSEERNEIVDIIQHATPDDLLLGLAKRGAVTRTLAGDVLKVTLKIKPKTRSQRSPRRRPSTADPFGLLPTNGKRAG
jgi:ribosomal protein S30